MKLANQVVLITGAARGSGAGHARVCIAEGAKVILADVADDVGETLAAELGVNAFYVHLDVSDEQQWIKAIARSEEQFGPISVLVNNAGIVHSAALEDYSVTDWNRVISVNLTGIFLGIKHVTPSMKAMKRGSIINVSSLMGERGAAHYYSYVASKWGIRGLTKSAAIELGVHGVRVNTVLPGFIVTEMTTSDDPHELEIPLGRGASPEELARTIVYLACEDSSFTTGAEISVNGGQSANIPLYDKSHGVFLSGPRSI